jgi:FkbM family methyltransferase
MSRESIGRRLQRLLLGRLGLRLSRARHEGEFTAMPDTLQRLAAAGYAPRVVLDVGANVGEWAALARQMFPAADLWCFEPQAACHPRLSARCAQLGRATVVPVALSDTDLDIGRMLGGGRDGSTGAWLGTPNDEGEPVRVQRLDTVVGDRCSADDRVMLKLDVEGHEALVLQGATHTLQAVEVVIAEWSAYRPGDEPTTSLETLCRMLIPQGFALYDMASLSRRARDGRLRQGDAVFVRTTSPVLADRHWR